MASRAAATSSRACPARRRRSRSGSWSSSGGTTTMPPRWSWATRQTPCCRAESDLARRRGAAEEKRGMATSEEDAPVRITHERLQNVIEALSYASVDEFDACLALLESNMAEDAFTELETAFMIFVKELRA